MLRVRHVSRSKSSPDHHGHAPEPPPLPRPSPVIVTLAAQRKLSAVFAFTADTDAASHWNSANSQSPFRRRGPKVHVRVGESPSNVRVQSVRCEQRPPRHLQRLFAGGAMIHAPGLQTL